MEQTLIGLALGILGGLLGIGLCSAGNRRTVNYTCLGVGAVMAVLCVVTWMQGYMNDAGTVLAVLMPTIIVSKYRSYLQAELSRLKASADELKEFVSRHFRELDTDGNGVITRLDLFDAEDRWQFGDKGLTLFNQLCKHLSLIGHVVDCSVAIAPMTGTVMYAEHHGVNMSDIQRWPQKVAQEYVTRFGQEAPKSGAPTT